MFQYAILKYSALWSKTNKLRLKTSKIYYWIIIHFIQYNGIRFMYSENVKEYRLKLKIKNK